MLIHHRHDDCLARLGFPWCVSEDGRPQQHFRTHMEALKYCFERMQ